MIVLKLLGTSGCHLCDVARGVLWQAQGSQPFEFVEVDIAFDDAMVELYGTKIPVLLDGDGRSLCWPFGAEDVLGFL